MKLHKFLKFTAILGVLCAFMTPVALADENPVTVRVDNTTIEFDQNPVIDNGRTLVPVRAVFEHAGAEVEWIQETQTAVLTKDNYEVSIKLGESFITKNGAPIAIDCPSQIINNRILIPVRAIAEAMDFGVTWNPVYRSVLIATNGKAYRPNAQWKTGFRPLKEHGFYVEASVTNLTYDLNGDGEGDVLDFKVQPEAVQKAILWIMGSDFSEILNEVCDAPFAIGVVDINESDNFKELIFVDSEDGIRTAHFFRYNGFDLFELDLAQDGVDGIDFHQTLFFDGVENIISDLDGLCFLNTMVCPGIYSLEEDVIKRYYLDCKNAIDMTFSPEYPDDMAYYIKYTDAYVSGEYVGSDNAKTIMVSQLPKNIKILDMYMDSSNPANFEFFVEFDDNKKAVIWPYSV